VTRSFARHHKTFRGFVHHADARHGTRHGARLIGTRIVDDQDVVGWPRLGQKGMQTGRKQSRFVVRAEDHANRQTGNLCPRMLSRIADRCNSRAATRSHRREFDVPMLQLPHA
jgi:hypothetical protein